MAAYKVRSPISVSEGGTGKQSFTTYAVVCAGTTSTGALQSIASVGSANQVLTSNGDSSLPTFQNAPTSDTNVVFELVAGDPASPSDGDVWFDTVANAFQGEANGSPITFNVT